MVRLFISSLRLVQAAPLASRAAPARPVAAGADRADIAWSAEA